MSAHTRRPVPSCATISPQAARTRLEGEREPDLEAIAEQFAELGYIDDAAYALSKSRALSSRGYGKRRLDQKAADRRGRRDGRRSGARACRRAGGRSPPSLRRAAENRPVRDGAPAIRASARRRSRRWFEPGHGFDWLERSSRLARERRRRSRRTCGARSRRPLS